MRSLMRAGLVKRNRIQHGIKLLSTVSAPVLLFFVSLSPTSENKKGRRYVQGAADARAVGRVEEGRRSRRGSGRQGVQSLLHSSRCAGQRRVGCVCRAHACVCVGRGMQGLRVHLMPEKFADRILPVGRTRTAVLSSHRSVSRSLVGAVRRAPLAFRHSAAGAVGEGHRASERRAVGHARQQRRRRRRAHRLVGRTGAAPAPGAEQAEAVSVRCDALNSRRISPVGLGGEQVFKREKKSIFKKRNRFRDWPVEKRSVGEQRPTFVRSKTRTASTESEPCTALRVSEKP